METLPEMYIGNGIYVSYDGYQLRLRTPGFSRRDNELFLEPRVWKILVDYAQSNIGDGDSSGDID